MEELKTQIQHESSLAANYARRASAAFAENNQNEWWRINATVSHAAGRRCQQLIQQYQALSSTIASS
ncbi:hypothetical protein NIES4071_24270 [Calothrix sp. NIES-4071]|nr:hypothetical protein NIES4071_24270 [Calothrix sp. NIES-4071]BAZ56750.1 hypothetical protein NIES4105_24210 [Calothrix sp. NIES-4105]